MNLKILMMKIWKQTKRMYKFLKFQDNSILKEQKYELTPQMQQYMGIKNGYKDCILFYRLGDFYEMFFDDALTASKELEITLTGRNCGQEERAPMCGVPFHSCEPYINKLVERGYRVAICEQVEDPNLAKGIVRRDVIRVVTPGTNVITESLDETKNNYINSACPSIAFSILCGSIPMYLCVTVAELCCSNLCTRAMSKPLFL